MDLRFLGSGGAIGWQIIDDGRNMKMVDVVGSPIWTEEGVLVVMAITMSVSNTGRRFMVSAGARENGPELRDTSKDM
jgi:hypothetical protein